MQIQRLIQIGIDARKSRRGAREVEESHNRVVQATRRSSRENDRYSKSQSRVMSSTNRMNQALQGLVSTMVATQQIRNGIRDVADFELSIVGIGKTTDIVGSELDELGEDVDLLSRRLGVGSKELSNYARFAGQMGIRGTPELTKFSETIARLSLTLDDLNAQEAAKELAQFIAITGRADSDIFRIGNAVTSLGNNFRATEDQIVRASVEVAKALVSFEASAEESLAIGTTLATLRVRPELASSSINRTFIRIDEAVRTTGDGLEALTELTGISGEAFGELWNRDRFEAFRRFLQGINEVREQGGSVAQVLEQVNIKGQENLRVIPALALQVDVLGEAFKTATDQIAIDERLGDLQKESDRVLDTFSNSLDRVGTAFTSGRRNFIERMFGEPGELKEFTFDVANAIELVFQLDGSTDNMTDRSKALAVALKAVGLGLAGIIGLSAVSFVGSMAVQMGKAAIATSQFALFLTGALLPALAVLGAAVLGFELGSFFFNEFKIVQQSAAVLISALMAAWLNFKGFFKGLTIDLGEFWERFLRGSGRLLAHFLDFLGEDEAAADMRHWAENLGNTMNQSFSDLISIAENGRDDLNKLMTEGILGPNDLSVTRSEFPNLARSGGTLSVFGAMMGNMRRSQAFRQDEAMTDSQIESMLRWFERLENLNIEDIEIPEARQIIGLRRDQLVAEFERLIREDEFSVPIEIQAKINREAVDREMEELKNATIARFAEIEEEFGGKERKGQGFVSDFIAGDIIKVTGALKNPEIREAIDSFTDSFLGIEKIKERTLQFADSTDKAGEETREFERDLSQWLETLGETTAQVERLNRRMTDMLLNIAREKSLLGESSDARQEALQIAKFQAVAEERFAGNTDMAAAAVRVFTDQLKDLNKARAEIEFEDLMKELDFEASLVGRIDNVRERMEQLEDAGPIIARAFGEGTDEARDALDKLTDKIETIQELERMEELADSIGNAFASSFEDAIFEAESLRDVLNALGRDIARLVFQQTAGRAVSSLVSGALFSVFGDGVTPSALGNLFDGGQVRAFAKGGLIDSPVMFPLQQGLGIAGEAGPEIIAPVHRMSDGSVGIKADGIQPKVESHYHYHMPPGTDVSYMKRNRRQFQQAASAATSVTRIPRG